MYNEFCKTARETLVGYSQGAPQRVRDRDMPCRPRPGGEGGREKGERKGAQSCLVGREKWRGRGKKEQACGWGEKREVRESGRVPTFYEGTFRHMCRETTMSTWHYQDPEWAKVLLAYGPGPKGRVWMLTMSFGHNHPMPHLLPDSPHSPTHKTCVLFFFFPPIHGNTPQERKLFLPQQLWIANSSWLGVGLRTHLSSPCWNWAFMELIITASSPCEQLPCCEQRTLFSCIHSPPLSLEVSLIPLHMITEPREDGAV